MRRGASQRGALAGAPGGVKAKQAAPSATTAAFAARFGVPHDRALDVLFRAAQESEIPNFKASYLGRFPLVLADFWTSDHLSERPRRVDVFSVTRARGTLTLKRR